MRDSDTFENHKSEYHKSVLMAEVLEYLDLQPDQDYSGKIYVDATFGGGGHTRAILEQAPGCQVIAFDWDKEALALNGQALKAEFGDRLQLVWGNFSQIIKLLKKNKITKVDGILADFGTSQHQIINQAGFSVYRDTPLDMRMSSAHHKISAAEFINKANERDLRWVFVTYGQEKYATKIARAIIARRTKKRFYTTGDLADFIASLVPRKKNKKIHSATKIFQALRIYVNKELDNIEALLKASLKLLNNQGRLVCISFHSLEDRLVKQFMRDHSLKRGFNFELLTAKVVRAGDAELGLNPAARSARLRAAIYHT